MRRCSGRAIGSAPSNGKPLVCASRCRTVEPGGPAASSRSTTPSSAATSTARAVTGFETEASRTACDTSPCVATWPLGSTTPAAANSTGQSSIWRSACTRGDTSHAMERRNISGTGAYEPIVGYSRAVVVGDRVHVSGTAANPADGSPPPEDIYDQTRVCLELIGTALERAGTSLEHVVRTRVYLTNADDFDGFARAHAEVFGDVRPANTTVLAGLFDPRWKVEIEVEAVLP